MSYNRKHLEGRPLSKQEQDILNLFCRTGDTTSTMAKQLGISEGSTRMSLLWARRKRGARSLNHLLVMCWREAYNKLATTQDTKESTRPYIEHGSTEEGR